MPTYEYERPQIIRDYRKQVEFIDAPTKNAIIEATSKAGKTVGCLVWLFEQAFSPWGSFRHINREIIPSTQEYDSKEGMAYWWVAPVSDVTKIAFRRMKKFVPKELVRSTNETERTITLINGAILVFKSADNPDSLYGEDVYAAVLDESTRMKEDAYIAVDSTMTATQGPMRIIGNVKGAGNWSYKLAREVELGKLKDWSYFKLTAKDAIDSGVLSESVLEEKRSRLPNGVFLELYYAIPFANSANKFAYCFDKSKHVAECKVNFDYPVYLSFDFNRNPISCNVIQYYDNTVHIPHVFKLANSNIYLLCEHIRVKLSHPKRGYNPDIFIINGDAAGNAGSAMTKDNLNYFKIIKQELNLSMRQMQQLTTNPKIEENQVLVNAVLEHEKHKIDPNEAAALIFDLEFAEMLPDGTLKKGDRNDPAQQLDALDGYRYWCNRNMRHYQNGRREK